MVTTEEDGYGYLPTRVKLAPGAKSVLRAQRHGADLNNERIKLKGSVLR